MGSFVHLKKFSDSELILNDEETIQVLKFIFEKQKDAIAGMVVDRKLREFAQGLLVEAIDASYAMGFVHSLIRHLASPGQSLRATIKSFGSSASRHWFKHATARDLTNIQIYERVRERLESNFGRILRMHLNGTANNLNVNSALVDYAVRLPRNASEKIWMLS